MLSEKMSRMPVTKQSSVGTVNPTRRKRRSRGIHPRDHRDRRRNGEAHRFSSGRVQCLTVDFSEFSETPLSGLAWKRGKKRKIGWRR
jgi:hypothetical protein